MLIQYRWLTNQPQHLTSCIYSANHVIYSRFLHEITVAMCDPEYVQGKGQLDYQLF